MKNDLPVASGFEKQKPSFGIHTLLRVAEVPTQEKDIRPPFK
jgi:hypothetical protein